MNIYQKVVPIFRWTKQRLAIARAIIRRPEIYIFDDSFSALDYQTDAKLRARLKKKRQNLLY